MQQKALVASMERDVEYAKRKEEFRKKEELIERGDAPEGRVSVVGEVLCVKDKGSYFGMLVELENKSKVWTSVPERDKETGTFLINGSDPVLGASLTKRLERGEKILLTATFTRKEDDKSFAFGKRPVVTRNLK